MERGKEGRIKFGLLWKRLFLTSDFETPMMNAECDASSTCLSPFPGWPSLSCEPLLLPPTPLSHVVRDVTSEHAIAASTTSHAQLRSIHKHACTCSRLRAHVRDGQRRKQHAAAAGSRLRPSQRPPRVSRVLPASAAWCRQEQGVDVHPVRAQLSRQGHVCGNGARVERIRRRRRRAGTWNVRRTEDSWDDDVRKASGFVRVRTRVEAEL